MNVTKTFLPPFDDYVESLKRVWDSGWVTNRGENTIALEQEIKQKLGTKTCLAVNNGTLALQIALKALDIKGEVITTPLSYVATTTSILWEHCDPVFVDVLPETGGIDPALIEQAITPRTTCIMAVHCYGIPCDVEAIGAIAKKHSLKIIYDAAHSFGVTVKGQSIFNYGDISTTSFHATKLFNSVEGGGIFCANNELHEKCRLLHQFGHDYDDYISQGTNAKMSEFHSIMGRLNLRHLDTIIALRKEIVARYTEGMSDLPIRFIVPRNSEVQWNFAYCPILFGNETALLQSFKYLKEVGINCRRYFYPALNTLPYLGKSNPCPEGEGFAKRVLCLPLFPQMTQQEQSSIIRHLKDSFKS